MSADTDSTPSMVIIGAGHCGGRIAEALLTQGWSGWVDLVGTESHHPYERPPLSKGLLTGEASPADCLLWKPDGMAPAALDASARARLRRHHQAAVAIDAAGRRVQLADGRWLPYEGLALATGGAPRRLGIAGADLPGVLALRTLDDAAALAPHLGVGRRLLVVGGGFIGLEVAASARQRGATVVLVEGAPRLMGRAVPPEVATEAEALHRAQGVDLRLGTGPTAIEARAGGGLRVSLSDASVVDVDAVVVGIGIEPAVALALDAGLQVGRGIVVNRELQASSPGIYAAGDVAEFPSALSGLPIRQETWHNAETQAQVLAGNLLGQHRPYDSTPWFWSDQYDHQVQVAGEPGLGVRAVTRPLDGPDRIVFHLAEDGRLVGMSAWGQASRMARECKLARTLVERAMRPDPAALADPATKLKGLLAGA